HDRQSSFLVIDRSPSCLFILPLLAALPIFSSLWLSWACLGGLLRQSLAVASMDFAIRSLRSAVASFYPRTLPPMLRANYGRELLAWWFLPMMLGAVEAGVISVIAKRGFMGVESITPAQLNFAVAAVTAAPSLANITSFMWASITHGRSKIKFITWLQVLTAVFVAMIALAPQSLFGLMLLCAATYAARICWTGVILIRTAVWRNNYPRADRAKIAGKLASVQAVVMCVV